MITKILQYRLAREMLGLLMLAVAVFLFVSFGSYNPGDPSFNLEDTRQIKVQNLAGVIGANISSLFFTLIGYTAFFLPVFLLIAAVIALFNIPLLGIPGRLLSLLFFFLITSTLFDLMFGGINFGEYKILAGGILGRFLGEALEKYLNVFGAFLILIPALIISMMALFQFSLFHTIKTAGKAARGVYSWMHGFWAVREERLRRTQSEEAQERRRKLAPKPKEEEPPIVASPRPAPPPPAETGKQKEFDFMKPEGDIELPPLSYLEDPEVVETESDRETLTMNARILKKKLYDFGIDGEVAEIRPGPVVTLYEFVPAPGIKINRIVSLSDDLAMALRAMNVRIIAPLPGKSAVGIEIPNPLRQTVYLKEILATEDFQRAESQLVLALGKDSFGNPFFTDLKKMPHLLVAGATGSGKSVCLNALITSVLYKASPKQVRFIMIDPKMLELSLYSGLPHLLLPVVTDTKRAAVALRWAVNEMERRYRLLAEKGVRNIDSYNQRVEKELADGKKPAPPKEGEEPEALPEILPYLVIFVDELADLMITVGREVEESVTRLSQMARAAGIHLILATQRPSVDVITGVIKANFPARISFQVTSRVDSRTILDSIGAETLLGRGDMLFLPPTAARPIRVHGPLITENEIKRIVNFLKDQAPPQYDESILEEAPSENGLDGVDDFIDERYEDAVRLVVDSGQASISMVQRRLRVGYNRAARMIERMEREGVVGPSDGIKAREVLIKPAREAEEGEEL